MTQRDAMTRVIACCWGLGGAMGLAGCLVTEKAEFTVRNTPPAITNMSPSAITRIPDEPPLLCGGRPGFEITLDVNDPDVDDDVEVKVRVNRRDVLDQASRSIPRSGRAQRDTTTWCVRARPSDFTNACNLLELYVSSDWVGVNGIQPKIPGDLTEAKLLVLARVSDEPGASADDCVPILAELDRESAAAAAQTDAGP
jgi:hypothetical protein